MLKRKGNLLPFSKEDLLVNEAKLDVDGYSFSEVQRSSHVSRIIVRMEEKGKSSH